MKRYEVVAFIKIHATGKTRKFGYKKTFPTLRAAFAFIPIAREKIPAFILRALNLTPSEYTIIKIIVVEIDGGSGVQSNEKILEGV